MELQSVCESSGGPSEESERTPRCPSCCQRTLYVPLHIAIYMYSRVVLCSSNHTIRTLRRHVCTLACGVAASQQENMKQGYQCVTCRVGDGGGGAEKDPSPLLILRLINITCHTTPLPTKWTGNCSGRDSDPSLLLAHSPRCLANHQASLSPNVAVTSGAIVDVHPKLIIFSAWAL